MTTTRPLYDTYDFTLKYGSGTSLMRISSLRVSSIMYNRDYYYYNGIDTTLSNDMVTDLSFGFAIGREHRKDLSDNIELFYGLDLTFSYSKDHRDSEAYDDSSYYYLDKVISVTPGVRAVLGLNYIVKDHFVIGVEFHPGISYSRVTDRYIRQTDTRIYYDRSYIYNYFRVNLNSTVLFTFAYRF
jgi:hypothetical protein